jgi:single-stranded DNA-specific DHH superfamily exonuclease
MNGIDLAALGTVADVVPLTGRKRAITALGLARIQRAGAPGRGFGR